MIRRLPRGQSTTRAMIADGWPGLLNRPRHDARPLFSRRRSLWLTMSTTRARKAPLPLRRESLTWLRLPLVLLFRFDIFQLLS